MDIIYRIENGKGQGPYNCHPRGEFRERMMDSHCDRRHKAPFEDRGIDRSPAREEFCGFESLHKLCRWFSPEELKNLSREGFNVSVIYGEITAPGQQQVLFKR